MEIVKEYKIEKWFVKKKVIGEYYGRMNITRVAFDIVWVIE